MGATVKKSGRLISEKQVSSNDGKVEVTAESKGKSGNGQKVRASDKLKNKSAATAERSKSRQGPKASRDGGKNRYQPKSEIP